MNSRKRKVLEASLQLFVEKGIQQTSIQDILDQAHISKGTFYNYFSSKNECVLAILEQARYEANLRRHELLVGKDIQDVAVLIEQIIVLHSVNKEQNLFPIFEAVFHSGEDELKKMVGHHRIFELEWLANRFIDVFGERARPYTFECAVLFYGMLQSVMMTWRSVYSTNLELKKTVRVAIRNISVILEEMIASREVILNDETFYILQRKLEKNVLTLEAIIEQLKGFIQGIHSGQPHPSGEEFSAILLEELERPELRYHVIEVILKPFREAFAGTSHVAEAKEIANHVWYYMKSICE